MLCSSAYRRFAVPAAVFMSSELQYEISAACATRRLGADDLALAQWKDLVPRLSLWPRVDTHGGAMEAAMPEIIAAARLAYDNDKADTRARRMERLEMLVAPAPVHAVDRAVATRVRDTALAREVAVREMHRAIAARPVPMDAAPTSITPAPPRDIHMPDAVDARGSASVSFSSVGDTAIVSGASTPLHGAVASVPPLTPQAPSAGNTASEVRSSKRRRIARVVDGPGTPDRPSSRRSSCTPSQRPALAELDVNSLGPLSFAATTRTGRERRPTEKGRGYFNM
jgi:hypothetical protein